MLVCKDSIYSIFKNILHQNSIISNNYTIFLFIVNYIVLFLCIFILQFEGIIKKSCSNERALFLFAFFRFHYFFINVF